MRGCGDSELPHAKLLPPMGAQYTHFSCFPKGAAREGQRPGLGQVWAIPRTAVPLPPGEKCFLKSHQESSESWAPGPPILAGNPEGGLVPAFEP